MSFGDRQRIVQLALKVSQTWVEAPFTVAGITADEAEERLGCWSGTGLDQYGRPIRRSSSAPPTEYYIAVIPLGGDGKVTKKRIAYNVKQAVLAGTQMALLPADDLSRVEVYDTEQMKRKKTLLATEPLSRLSTENGNLLLHGRTSVDVYSLKTYKRIRTLGSTTNPAASAHSNSGHVTGFKDGVIINGLLYDGAGEKPLLIVSPGAVQALAGADSKLYNGSFLRRDASQIVGNQRVRSHNGSGIVAGPISIPDRGVKRVTGTNDFTDSTCDVTIHDFKKSSVNYSYQQGRRSTRPSAACG